MPKTKKLYKIIYADPPWSYASQTGRGAARNHYPTMTLEAICQHPVSADKDAVLLLWATFPKLPAALKVMEAWGFKYRTQFLTWIKTTRDGRPCLGLGHYTRSNAEVLLLGTRGAIAKSRLPSRTLVSSVLMDRRREHSRKPDVVRSMITKVFPEEFNKIELFARTQTPGWDTEGNQVDTFTT